MDDFEPQEPTEERPSDQAPSGATGFWTGCGSGLVLLLALTMVVVWVVGPSGGGFGSNHGSAGAAVILGLVFVSGYLFFISYLASQWRGEAGHSYRQGLWVSAAITLALVLLNPLTLCVVLSAF
jgi:hypothetical protein